MAFSPPPNDQRNFECVTVASVDFIKLPLKNILESHIKPVDLFKGINSCPALLSGKYKLRQDQLKLCFLQPQAIPDYTKFDVTLLYTLIRNLCPSLNPTKGWGKEPDDADIQIGDDIERLRLFRNNYHAHADSAAISDADFKDIWKNLNSVVNRIQKYMYSKGHNVDYKQELSKIESSKIAKDHLESCKLLLEALMNIQKHTDEKDEPEIFLKGEDRVMCGGTTRFEANAKNVDFSLWQFIWQKRTGNSIKCIDTNKEKYKGSSNSILLIQNVSKEDEGEYQAVLSREANGIEYKISSNSVYLHALGELPLLNDLRVTTGDEGITIHYSYEVLEQSPEVKLINWRKNGEPLDRKSEKYIGGSLNENCFTITSPTDADRGKYSCTITNAVGSVAKAVKLGIPNITTDKETVIRTKTVKLVGNVFVYDGSPDILEVFWTKNGEKIDTQGSGGRLSTVTVDDPSLTIRDVSHVDAGEYKLIARNAVGTASSDIIAIGVPNVNLERLENEGSGIHGFRATIKATPSPCNVQWSKKGNYEDEFQPIDADGEEFKGTTNNLPHPKLVVKDRNLLENNCFQIKVSNFVGNTIENISDTKYRAEIVCNLISSPGPQRVLLDCCLHFLIRNLKNPNETWTKDKIVTHVKKMISKLVENNERDRLEFFCQSLYQDESLSNTLLNCGEDFYALIISMEEKYNAQDIIFSEGSFCMTFCFENNLHLENFLQKLESKDEQLIKDLSKLTLNKTLLKIFSISPQQVWWTAWTVKIYKGTQLFEKIFTYPIEGRSEDYSAIKSKILSRSEIMGDKPGPSIYPFFLLDKSSENYLRLTRLITTVCGSLLRDILSHHIEPVNLRKELDKNKRKLEKYMTIEQVKQLYWTAESNLISPKDLDISVLYMLLRNICTKLPPPKTGWGKRPQKGDNSESAFIERVRQIRNTILARNTHGKVSNTDFQQYWEELENSIIAMEKQLTGDVLHQYAMSKIKDMTFNKDDAKKYKREIQQSEGKKILMAEEPSENPEHLSFKKKLKRFQNKEASPSGSVKDDGRPNGKEILVKVFPNAKSLQARSNQAILKDDFSSAGSRPTLKKQDSCEVASDYLGDIGNEIKDSDFVDDVCDSKRFPVWEEILTSSDSCSNIKDSSNRKAKFTCTMEHELAVDIVTPHPVSDYPWDETELQREDSSDQAPLQLPYPAAPYPLVDVKSFTGRSMSVGSCPPIGFEGLCDHPALSITYPSLSSHIGDTSNYSSNSMIEPEPGMPLPDFGGLHLKKDS